MANRYYRSQFNFSNSAKPVTLTAKVSIGASGAPTLVSGTGMGILSVARVSAGLYDITLDRAFNGLMMVNVMPIAPSGVSAAPIINVVSEQVSNSSVPKLRIQTNDADTPAATDPASGESLMIEIKLNDSSLGF